MNDELDILPEIDPDSNYFDEVFSNLDGVGDTVYSTVDEFNKHIKDKPNFLTIISYNIRSFSANSDLFFYYLLIIIYLKLLSYQKLGLPVTTHKTYQNIPPTTFFELAVDLEVFLYT